MQAGRQARVGENERQARVLCHGGNVQREAAVNIALMAEMVGRRETR